MYVKLIKTGIIIMEDGRLELEEFLATSISTLGHMVGQIILVHLI